MEFWPETGDWNLTVAAITCLAMALTDREILADGRSFFGRSWPIADRQIWIK